jgi:hypothetical protein
LVFCPQKLSGPALIPVASLPWVAPPDVGLPMAIRIQPLRGWCLLKASQVNLIPSTLIANDS